MNICLHGPLSHLPSLAPQPAHLLLPPLGSHGAEVFTKMALKPREVKFVLHTVQQIHFLRTDSFLGDLFTVAILV